MTDLARTDRVKSLGAPLPLPPPLRVPETQDSLDVRRILGRLRNQWHQILTVTVVVLVPAVIATYLTTPLYKSTALVQVSMDPVQVLPYRDVANTVVNTTYENYMGTQEQLLNGGMLRARVRNRLESEFAGQPAAEEAARLGDRFGLRKIERSELFEMSYLAPTPEVAATVVNLYAEEYARHNFELRQDTRLRAEQELKTQLASLEERLQLSEKELMAYAQANDIMSLEQGQVDPLQERLSALTQTVAAAEAQVATARSGLQSLQQAQFSEFPERLSTETISSLSGRVLQAEQELTTLRGTFGEGWPAVVDKRNEVALLRQQLEQERTAVIARNLEQARLDLESADARRRLAQSSLDEQKDLVNQFHDASIQYSILKREADTNRNLYEGLLERLRETGVLAGTQFGNIQIVETGQPSALADSPNVVRNIALATLLGLSLGVCLVLLRDSWDTSISSLDEIDELSPLPSLGGVPLIKDLGAALAAANTIGPSESGGQVEMVVRSTQRNSSLPFELQESIGSICASVLLSRSNERPRTIVVTSATHAEGKTTLVSHLGVAFAQAGLKTLLVEADMRKPDLSKKFSIHNKNGLSLCLAGLVPFSVSIQPTSTNNLFVASGGPVPPNPAGLLHSERLTEFLAHATSEFELVILDAPPVLQLADARILGSKADGVIMVVRAGRTAKNLVRRACALVEQSGATVLGTVLNGWKPNRAELSQYRYYRPVA